MKEERAGFRVSGVVQGVGFRWWTRRTAAAMGLRGAVRNLADGAVEVHVCGPPDVIAELAERLREGPSGARVRDVERVDSALPLPENGFTIEG